VLVSGPGLDAARAEVGTPAAEYGRPTVLAAGDAPAGADELPGLASALLPLGTAGIVASVAQVSDRAAAPLMLGPAPAPASRSRDHARRRPA
jgi:hypothetical protein